MKASIIICTYNEEKTVSDVVIACCKYNHDCEVIVVDDGSKDKTSTILSELKNKYSFKYERLKRNRGKSWAMVHGVKVSTNEIILFFDADVSNIKKRHFECLLKPLVDNEADMILGQPSETTIDYRMNPFRFFTGERALLKTDIAPILKDIKNIRFGVETFLNLYYQAKGKRVKYVLLEGLKHRNKFQKTNSMKATKELAIEGKDIALTIIKNRELITQRVELLLNRMNARVAKNLDEMQSEINKKLVDLKRKLDL